MVDLIIPGNDDALRAIRLFTSKIADAVLEGRSLYEQQQLEAAKAEAVEAGADLAAGEEVAYAGTPEELEEVAEAYDPDEMLPPHLRPRPVPEKDELADESGELAAEEADAETPTEEATGGST
jgi:small subunit ribosomal protein S2